MTATRRTDVAGDAALVAGARDGDKAAFAELVTRHVRTAEALVARVLGDAELARDVSQEAVVVALVSLDRLRTPERFGSWLCGIALNVARRWLRELRFRGVAVDLDPVDPAPGPDELAEASLVACRVRHAIDDLPRGQRDAVWLFYLQGLTHREVATELGISVGAVKARLHQARAALARRLADEIEEVPQMSPTQAPATWVDVEVAEVRRFGGPLEYRRHVVVLREVAGERTMPIWIPSAEAVALALSLENAETQRPMTYHFAAGLLGGAGASVSEVRITRLAESVFYAVVVLDGPAGGHELDARPSDALNLALVVGAPIRAESGVLDEGAEQGGTAWPEYPATTANLVAEFREGAGRSVRDLEALAGEDPTP